MTNKTVCPHSVLRCTMLVGTAGVLSGVVLGPTSAQSQTGAATAGRHGGQADQPAGGPLQRRGSNPAYSTEIHSLL